jgi:hypothetical protein
VEHLPLPDLRHLFDPTSVIKSLVGKDYVVQHLLILE